MLAGKARENDKSTPFCPYVGGGSAGQKGGGVSGRSGGIRRRVISRVCGRQRGGLLQAGFTRTRTSTEDAQRPFRENRARLPCLLFCCRLSLNQQAWWDAFSSEIGSCPWMRAAKLCQGLSHQARISTEGVLPREPEFCGRILRYECLGPEPWS